MGRKKLFNCPYCKKGVYGNEAVIWEGDQYVHSGCFLEAHPTPEPEESSIRLVMFSIQKVCKDKEHFSPQVEIALREYADRVRETGGEVIDDFKTKSGCRVKMFYTECSKTEEEEDENQ